MKARLTAQQLDSLPAGSVVLRGGSEALIAHDAPHRITTRLWGTSQSGGMFTSEWVAGGGATLLWEKKSAGIPTTKSRRMKEGGTNGEKSEAHS